MHFDHIPPAHFRDWFLPRTNKVVAGSTKRYKRVFMVSYKDPVVLRRTQPITNLPYGEISSTTHVHLLRWLHGNHKQYLAQWLELITKYKLIYSNSTVFLHLCNSIIQPLYYIFFRKFDTNMSFSTWPLHPGTNKFRWTATVCPRSLNSFYTVSYFIKWIKTFGQTWVRTYILR